MTTPERLAKMEQQAKNTDEKVDDIKKMLTKHVEWEEDKYHDMETKYAGKWTEKIIIGILLLTVAAFVSFLKLQ